MVEIGTFLHFLTIKDVHIPAVHITVVRFLRFLFESPILRLRYLWLIWVNFFVKIKLGRTTYGACGLHQLLHTVFVLNAGNLLQLDLCVSAFG